MKKIFLASCIFFSLLSCSGNKTGNNNTASDKSDSLDSDDTAIIYMLNHK